MKIYREKTCQKKPFCKQINEVNKSHLNHLSCNEHCVYSLIKQKMMLRPHRLAIEMISTNSNQHASVSESYSDIHIILLALIHHGY